MKTKRIYLLFFLSATLLLSSFAGDKPSELSKLMKQMLTYVQQEKRQIENNKPALRFPTSLQKVSKAKVTAGKKLSDEHEKYVADFFAELNQYYKQQDTLERRRSFDLLINSCIHCHQHECPGPITVIKKNRFEPREQ